MEIVILFGGGDAGGIVITPKGIRRIPPFGPDVLRELRAVNNLVNLGSGKEYADAAARLSGEALAQVNKAAGTSGAAVVFAEDDDIIYCGNGWRGPVPHNGGLVSFEQAGSRAA